MNRWESEELTSGSEARERQRRVLDEEIRLIHADAKQEEKRAKHLVGFVFRNWQEVEKALFAAGYLSHERLSAGTSDADHKEDFVRSQGLHAVRAAVTWLENVYREGGNYERQKKRTSPPFIDVFAEKLEFISPISVHAKDDGHFRLAPKGLKFVNECRDAAQQHSLE